MDAIYSWIYSVTWEGIKNILVSIPGVIVTAFSFYFACQKIGNKILVSYSIVGRKTSEIRISSLNLINKKNKPISIFSIHAIINNDIVVQLISFDTSLTLKALESAYVVTPEYSAIYLGGDRYEPDFMLPNIIEIYLITNTGKVRCTTINPPSINALFDFRHYRKAQIQTNTFNGKVYNDICKYAITYRLGAEDKTAFIMQSGFITGDWSFGYNSIPLGCMSSKEKVYEYLNSLGFDEFFDGMIISNLSGQGSR